MKQTVALRSITPMLPQDSVLNEFIGKVTG
jgi:hypothetical protein